MSLLCHLNAMPPAPNGPMKGSPSIVIGPPLDHYLNHGADRIGADLPWTGMRAQRVAKEKPRARRSGVSSTRGFLSSILSGIKSKNRTIAAPARNCTKKRPRRSGAIVRSETGVDRFADTRKCRSLRSATQADSVVGPQGSRRVVVCSSATGTGPSHPSNTGTPLP